MSLDFDRHLQHVDDPLRVARTGPFVWSDEDRHVAAFGADPLGYALRAVAPGVLPAQQARILLCLLLSSWARVDPVSLSVLRRVVGLLVLGLPAPEVATVLLAARRRRANHKHLTRATVEFLAGHPRAGQLAGTHRQVLRDCLEHALGRDTARGTARALALSHVDGTGAHRALLRFAAPGTVPVLIERVTALYRPDSGVATVAPVEPDPAPLLSHVDIDGSRPATVTATNRGDIAATLVHLYRGGTAPDLSQGLARYLDVACARLPRYPGTLAMVLDLSASMRGYGDREWAQLSQAVALRMVLERVCDRLVVVPVGGTEPEPSGATDLATGLLDALEQRPDLVAVVSDGYENDQPGDLARVAATLPRLGVATPVVFCHSTFGHSDDLRLRRPAPLLEQRAFWHEADFAALVLWLLARTGTGAAEVAYRQALLARLAAYETVLLPAATMNTNTHTATNTTTQGSR